MSAAAADRSSDCSACRGTGQVLSSLGGSPHPVRCPWCEGTGRFLGAEHDAQAAGGAERDPGA